MHWALLLSISLAIAANKDNACSAQLSINATTAPPGPTDSTNATTLPRELCPHVPAEYSLCGELPGRNTVNGLPQYFTDIQNQFEGYTIDFIFSVLDTFDPPPSQECIVSAQHIVCLTAIPPCDPETGLLLDVCEDSCRAYNTLLSSGVCKNMTDHAQQLIQTSSFTDLIALLEKYLNLNCSNPSTFYFSLNDSLSELHPNQCTDLFDAQTLDRVLNSSSGTQSPATTDGHATGEGESDDLAAILGGALGGGVALFHFVLVLLVLILICFCNIRRTGRKSWSTSNVTQSLDACYPMSVSVPEPDDKLLVKISAEEKVDYKTLYSSILVSYDTLSIGDSIGEGAFSTVHRGTLTSFEGALPRDIAIKTIKNVSSPNELKAFFSESLIMKDFNHPNVLGLVGVCFDTPDDVPYIILPYMVNGSLKEYLKTKRVHITNVDTYPEGLQLPALVKMCKDIAHGMAYLADRRFVHRDLAARNCLVDRNITVRVGDFGLAKDIYRSDYYRAKENARLPVKWMPPETLHDGISNEKTDIWSFGVTCWEVFSLGRTPYPGVQNHDMINFISSGGRLERPTLCPETFFHMMESCWTLKPEQRPLFVEVAEQLDNYWDIHIIQNDVGNSYINDQQFSL